MSQFFGTESVPLDLFSPVHLVTMGVLAAAGVCLIRAGMAGDEDRRRLLLFAMGAAILLLLGLRHTWKISAGLWTVQNDLPLHLCAAMAWLTVYGLWTRHLWALRLMYFFGIAGAIQAGLTPDASHGSHHFAFYQTMTSHGIAVIAGVWAVTVEGYRPKARDPWLALGVINVYAVAIYPLNRVLGSNYLYLIDKPPTASILDFFPDWPWYILLLEPVVIGLFLALRLPFRNPAAD